MFASPGQLTNLPQSTIEVIIYNQQHCILHEQSKIIKPYGIRNIHVTFNVVPSKMHNQIRPANNINPNIVIVPDCNSNTFGILVFAKRHNLVYQLGLTATSGTNDPRNFRRFISKSIGMNYVLLE
jgi:hypothetical protein